MPHIPAFLRSCSYIRPKLTCAPYTCSEACPSNGAMRRMALNRRQKIQQSYPDSSFLAARQYLSLYSEPCSPS